LALGKRIEGVGRKKRYMGVSRGSESIFNHARSLPESSVQLAKRSGFQSSINQNRFKGCQEPENQFLAMG